MKVEAKETVQKAVEIFDAKITFMSLVDKPANLRPFLVTKAENGKATFSTYGRILKVDKETHYITGIAYEPMVEDAHGNFMTEAEVEKAAYWFMKNGDKVDLQHSFETLDGACVVENWVAKSAMLVGNEEVQAGTWLVTVEVTDPDVWAAVENGGITGFSIGGVGAYGTEDVDIEAAGEEITKEARDVTNEAKNAAGNAESATHAQSSENKGIFKKLAEAFGLDVVEKGAVAEEAARRNKASAFWNAWAAFQDTVYHGHWDYFSDKWIEEFEPDPAKWSEAVSDLADALNDIRGEADIVKTLTAANPVSPIEKAGKKMSTANRDKLRSICQSLSDFCKEFEDVTDDPEENTDEKENPDNEKEDEIEMKPEDVQKMIDTAVSEAVTKALPTNAPASTKQPAAEPAAPAAAPVAKAEAPITKEMIASMVADAIAKSESDGDETGAPAAEEKFTLADVQKMIDNAVENVKKSRGYATNLGDSTVQKSAGEAHYLHGLLF